MGRKRIELEQLRNQVNVLAVYYVCSQASALNSLGLSFFNIKNGDNIFYLPEIMYRNKNGAQDSYSITISSTVKVEMKNGNW